MTAIGTNQEPTGRTGVENVTLIERPAIVEAAGAPPKRIEEFVGNVNTATAAVSVARMRSPAGWSEPGQRPEFDEYTLVLRGVLVVQTERRAIVVRAGMAAIVRRGEWVRYSTPEETEYISVCVPAFSPDRVHRDAGGAA